ncbi:hypothetical protein [Caulobacter phage Cr30]|uniref:hypothetical protein n=1 Tax=Caulobacter phage Cr30 TaxID=1357714 RepID=UPI0004A9B5B3|nr:hypothetical protein OZ74_gp228 [Caulobacter phage Cr30]AGS81115.1 hypothetical protein [Caulobacter phage Cr30]
MKVKWRVSYTEYERGWGQRPDGFKDFDSYEDAYKHYKEFNAQNNLPYVPDCYSVAHEPKAIHE